MGYLQEFFRPKIFKYKYTKNSVIHGIPRYKGQNENSKSVEIGKAVKMQ